MPPTPLNYQALFQGGQSLYLVVAVDAPRFTIIGASDIYLRATRRERDELIGKGIFEAFPEREDDPDAASESSVRASIERVLRTRQPHRLPIQKYDVPRPEAAGGGFEEKYWSAIHFPVFDDSGGLIHVAQRVEDITDLVKLNRLPGDRMETEVLLGAREARSDNLELVRANEELDRHRSELQYLNNKLTELDELKSQFFSNVSHELRTPLTLIIGPVESMIKSGTVDAGAKKTLNTVLRNARLLLRHVNDLLDVSKLDAGKMTIRYCEADLAQMVHLVCGHFSSLAVERHIDFVTDVAPLRAQVDTEKIQRLLMNLLSNAFKFVPEGGRVRCSLRIDGERICIEVGDSGPGIRPEHRQMVFERFRQVESGPARHFGGTGLGLAIARDFADLHRGRIDVGDAPEGGALFTVTLPREAPAGVEVFRDPTLPPLPDWVPEQETFGSSAPIATASTTSSEASTLPLVLVVEDNPDLNAFIRQALSQDYRTVEAANGHAGLDRAVELMPDLIVSDVMMPGMTGDMLVRELRLRPNLRSVPVLLLTAKADDDLRVAMLKAGASDYLTKPFSVEELKARVRNLIEVSAARNAAERANQAKSWFLSRMSHELRTPLNAIIGFAQLLEMDAGITAEQRDSVGLILRGGKHLLELINEVLDISRIESGSMSLSLEAVLVQDVLRSTADLIRPIAVNRGVVLQLPSSVPPALSVSADRQRLSQVLINLLSNAVKYNRPNGRVIVDVEHAGPDRLRLTVTDTGAGIAPSKLAMLFQPFQRLGAEQSDIEGTGLGLAVSRALAEAMGGSMGVTSDVGAGSKFWIELSIAQHVVVPRHDSRRMSTAPAGPVAAGTILYIEDNASNVRLMQRLLKYRPAVTLLHAASGEAGLGIMMSRRVDLVLLDLHLPGMSGREILDRLRDSNELASVPAVVLSADAAPGLADRLRSAGASGVLTKPIVVEEVLALLDRLLGGPSDNKERDSHE